MRSPEARSRHKSAVGGGVKLSTCAGDPGRCPFDRVAEFVGPAPPAPVVGVVVVAAVNAIVIGDWGRPGRGRTHRREGTCRVDGLSGPYTEDVEVVETGGRIASERRRRLLGWSRRCGRGRRHGARLPWPIRGSLVSVLCRVGYWRRPLVCVPRAPPAFASRQLRRR